MLCAFFAYSAVNVSVERFGQRRKQSGMAHEPAIAGGISVAPGRKPGGRPPRDPKPAKRATKPEDRMPNEMSFAP